MPSVEPFTSDVALEITSERDGEWVTAVHKLRSVGAAAQSPTVVLDVRECPLRLQDLRCSASSQPVQQGGRIVCQLVDGMTWDNATVHYSAPLDRSWVGRNTAILLPHLLPRVEGEDAIPRQQSLVRVVHDELVSGIDDIRIAVAASQVHAGSDLLALLYLHRGAYRHVPAGSALRVFYSEGAHDVIAQRRSVESAAADCAWVAAQLTEFFGIQAGDGVMLALETEVSHVTSSSGLVLTVDRDYLETYPPGTISFRTDIARRMCAQWWGTACQVAGREGRQVQWALAAAVSILVAEGVDAEYARLTELELARRAGWRLGDIFSSTGKDRRLVCGLAQHILRRLRQPGGRPALQALTADWWGTIGSVSAFRQELQV